MENVTIEITPLMASVLARLLPEEIANQRSLKEKDPDPLRDAIIAECRAIREAIYEKTGKWYEAF